MKCWQAVPLDGHVTPLDRPYDHVVPQSITSGSAALSQYTHTPKSGPAQQNLPRHPKKMIVVNTRGSLLPVTFMKPFVHAQ